VGYQLLQGDCIQVLPTLPAASVHCVVTSPPYFGLRDYGHDGQMGLEPTPSEYVQKLVAVFREVWRVLCDDGTVWLNLGDSYAGSWGNYSGQNRGNGSQREITNGSQAHQKAYDGKEDWRPPTSNKMDGIKPKDLIGIPWMVAFALRADGWYLRSDIIWHKPNPMPESVQDRPTKAHEYLFLLAKSERYYYDSQAIAEPAVTNDMRRPYGSQGAWQLDGRPEEQRPNGKLRGKAGKNAFRGQGAERKNATGPANRDGRDLKDVGTGPTRNKRSVWTVATRPYKGAHFATYPIELVRPCILASCPVGGVVLDPFNGSGTTGAAAIGSGRQYIGIDINPEYIELAHKRLSGVQPALVVGALHETVQMIGGERG